MNFPSGLGISPRKFAMRAFITEHHVFGNLNTRIAYVGIVIITALIKTSFPTLFRNFDLQLCNLSCMHVFRKFSAYLFDLPQIDGKPRYYSGLWTLRIPIVAPIVCLWCSGLHRGLIKVHSLSEHYIISISFSTKFFSILRCTFVEKEGVIRKK